MPGESEIWRKPWRENFTNRLRLQGWCGEIRFDEDMSRHTTFRIGGPAAVFAMPESQRDLLALFSVLPPEECVLVGAGSNLLVGDYGIGRVVVRLGHGLGAIHRQGQVLTCGAAAMMGQIARQAASWGLGGMEFAAGIPGTVGGAVYMNAGAHGREMSQMVRGAIIYVTGGYALQEVTPGMLNFGYRSSALQQKKDVLVSVTLELTPRSPDEIRQQMEANLAERREKQPLNVPSAGSFFKNPPGDKAGRLIESAGCKGLQVGGAAISELHANFLVNKGGATAHDVLDLSRQVQARVMDKFGVQLDPEVKFMGDFFPPETGGGAQSGGQ